MSAVELATKQCSSCGEAKPLSEFHRNAKHKDGLTYACKQCNGARVKASAQRRRAEMGVTAWLEDRAATVRESRKRTGNAAGKRYARARSRAVKELIEAHRAEFDQRMRVARYEIDREVES